MRRNRKLPLARPTSEFLLEVLDAEVLVYDRASHRAHCLTTAAARVWQLCDGRTSASVGESALRELGSADSLEAVLLQLQTAGLLRRDAARQVRFSRSRRAMFGKAALIVAAPVVFSIIAPSVAEAASVCGAKTQPCCSPGNTCNPTLKCQGSPLSCQ